MNKERTFDKVWLPVTFFEKPSTLLLFLIFIYLGITFFYFFSRPIFLIFWFHYFLPNSSFSSVLWSLIVTLFLHKLEYIICFVLVLVGACGAYSFIHYWQSSKKDKSHLKTGKGCNVFCVFDSQCLMTSSTPSPGMLVSPISW